MQIHELNDFSGALGQSSYIAVDNGIDTGKLSTADLLSTTNENIENLDESLNARIDNIITPGGAPSDAEVVDARLGGNGITYPTLGGAIRGQYNELKKDINEIREQTRNLFGSAELIADKYLSSAGTVTVEAGCYSFIFPCQPSTTYTVSKHRTTKFRIGLFQNYPQTHDTDSSAVARDNYDAITITTGANTNYMFVFFYNSVGETISVDDVIQTIQVEIGSSATDYIQPYTAVDTYARANVNSINAQIANMVPQIPINTDVRLPKTVFEANADSEWSLLNATAHEVFVYDEICRETRKCVRLFSDAGNLYGCAYADIPGGVDMTTHPVQVLVHLLETDNVANFSGLRLEFFSDNGGIWDTDKRAIMQIQYENPSDSVPDYNLIYDRTGWFHVATNPVPNFNASTKGANFDPTNVTKVGIQFSKVSADIRTIDLYKIAFIEPMLKPGIITIVDNFNVSVPAMADYAHSKGVRLNLSIIPGFYEGEPSAPVCASKEELDRIASQGHCIFNHTYTHPNFNDLTTLEINDQVNLAELWMQNNGYEKCAKVISVPSARFNSNSYRALINTNAKAIFHTWNIAGKMWYPFYPCTRCVDDSALDTSFASDVNAAIQIAQNAIAYGGIAVIGFHGTYWTLYPDAQGNYGGKWKEYIDAIAAIPDVYHYGLDEIINGQFV